MDAKELAIRELYAARARRDWRAVGDFLADEVGWYEPGDEDHSGDYRGRDDVVALLRRLVLESDPGLTLHAYPRIQARLRPCRIM